MSVEDGYFDAMFQASDDPWAMRQRWYERRKRALLLACLPLERYASVFEPGCANGETSAALAERCDRLLCHDTSLPAVALARQRLAGFAHVQVEHARLPRDWPDQRFDLIVLNELCYYLDAADLDRVIEQARASLTSTGQVLACHWQAPIEGCPLSSAQVHAKLDQQLGMQRLLSHEEADFRLDLWAMDGASVAQREGLR